MNISYIDLENLGIYEEDEEVIMKNKLKDIKPQVSWDNLIKLNYYYNQTKIYFIKKKTFKIYYYDNNDEKWYL